MVIIFEKKLFKFLNYNISQSSRVLVFSHSNSSITKVEYKILLGFIEKIFNKINELEYKFFSFNDGEVFTIITTDIYNVGSVITEY